MILTRLDNMHAMTQRFVSAFERLISRVHKLPNIYIFLNQKIGKGHCEWKKNMCGCRFLTLEVENPNTNHIC
jgi:hypothetical protein